MRIELFYWDGCPSHPEALALLQEVLAERGLDTAVELREVLNDAEAEELRFPGSPTIRIDGRDVVDPGGEPVLLTCRIYHRRDGRISPTPDPADLREALRAARDRRSAGTLI